MEPVESITKQTLQAYSDNTGKSGILNDPLPLITGEQSTPWLITHDAKYSVKVEELLRFKGNHKKLQNFHIARSAFAKLLLYPALVALLLKAVALFVELPLASHGLVDTLLSVGIVGFIIYWYNEERVETTAAVILPHQKFSSDFRQEAKKGVLPNLDYMEQRNASFYLSNPSLDLISTNIDETSLNTDALYNQMLRGDKVVGQMVRRLGLKADQLQTQAGTPSELQPFATAGIRSLILYAMEEAILTNAHTIEPLHIFLAMLRVFPSLHIVLEKNKISPALPREAARSHFNKINHDKTVGYLNMMHEYDKTGGVMKDLMYGYTFVLNKFSKDLTNIIANSKDDYGIGHAKEVEALAAIIGKVSDRHALLMGEPGVGKSSIVKGLAQSINANNAPEQLKGKRIIQLDLNGLIAHASQGNSLEASVARAMGELEKAGNTVLYIDEIQELISASGGENDRSLAGVLLPYILDGTFPIIGTINHSEYNKLFRNKDSLKKSFTIIEVPELNIQATMTILETMIKSLEEKYKIFITFPAIEAAATLAKRYVTEKKLPDGAVDTLESTISWAHAKGIETLAADHIAQYLSIQTNVAIHSVTKEEATDLLTLDERMRAKVIGQDHAIEKVVQALKRARTDLRDPNKPVGVYLFIGPTGVGKTYLTKTLAQEFFNDKTDIIRIDMSEYQGTDSIDKILGSNSGNPNVNATTLLDKIKRNPFTVVLFDEIEKAAPQVLDLFLQLFDEGRLTSNTGETADFTNSIIICTSNIGSKKLLTDLKQDLSNWEEVKKTVNNELKNSIRPELYNRFDDVITFRPHTPETLAHIVKLELKKLARRVQKQGIRLEWADTVPALIATKAYDPGLGARPIRRFIQDKIEGKIATQLLSEDVQSGSKMVIDDSWIA